MNVFFTNVAISIPGRKGYAKLLKDIHIFGSESMPKVFRNSVSGKPFTTYTDSGLFLDLLHFVGKGISDNVEYAVFVIGINCSNRRSVSI